MSKKTILIVEDEKEMIDLIKKKIETNDFSAIVAMTVEGAVDALNKNKIDAVWLDHYLSGDKNGFDLVIEAKKNEATWGKIPIFVVSNTAGPEEMQTYIELGVHKYYVKTDATMNQIIDEIKTVLDSAENK